MAISFRFETALFCPHSRGMVKRGGDQKETACVEPAASLAAHFVGQHAAFQENGSACHLFPRIFSVFERTCQKYSNGNQNLKTSS
jgi:hypothetical protein